MFARIASSERRILWASLLLLPWALAGCTPSTPGGGPDDQNDGAAIREITYAFGDASVPPEYHRSYTITVDAETARVVVDSYGDVLADEQYPATGQQFAELVASLETDEIANCTLDQNEGCGGGTSERIAYSDGQQELFSGEVFHCGGQDSGDLCGDVAAFADQVRSLIPNLDELLQEGDAP